MLAIVYSSLKLLTLLLVLMQSDDFGVEQQLERERLRTFSGPRNTMITIIAKHADGTPARGTIACAGVWYRHRDEGRIEWAEAYPFATDSRGAVGFNPLIDDEGVMDCTAVDAHLHTGHIVFAIEPVAIRTIIVR